MKEMKNLSVFLLTATVLLSSTACGDSNSTQSSSSGDNGGTSTGATVKIDQDIYNALSADYQFDTEYVKKNKTKFSGTLYMARAYGDELPGWEYVYDAYEKMYPNVTIENAEYSSGNAMKEALITKMSSSAEEIGLVQGNYVQDQLGQYGYNFQGGFVETVNPYASPAGEEVLIGDLINDYTFNNLRAERITFQNTSTCFYVNTTALAEVNMKVEDIKTWDDIIEACRLLKEKGYEAPFGVGGNNDSLTSKDFKWMNRIYLDQYYMDLIDDTQVLVSRWKTTPTRATLILIGLASTTYLWYVLAK
jgi:ABC-type glycerol-3-phosphate transport system substrate-binding protein